MVTVSAPAKVHLMGEHAVVHGKPALLAAINRRLTVTIEEGHDGIVIDTKEPILRDFILYALDVVKKEYTVASLPPLVIHISSPFPYGYHLGSSAALAVATVGAGTYFLKKLWNPMEINRLAYEVEKKQHGNPSGGDNTVVTFGGFLWYRKELEFLKSIWQLPMKLPQSLDHFFLINTGKPEETTKEMVTMVNEQCTMHNEKMGKVFSDNEEQTRRIAQALKEKDENVLIDAIHIGERALEEMGVVSDKVIPLIRKIEKQGGAAKILGGGGRKGAVGFLLCYHHLLETVKEVCMPYGYSVESIQLGEEGVRLENGKRTG